MTRQRNTKINNPLPDVTITLLKAPSKNTTAKSNKTKRTITIGNKKLRTTRRADRLNKNENGISNKNNVELFGLNGNIGKIESPLTKKRRCQQEKEDFHLAKMLQEYDDNARSPSSNRTIRYSLRSRNKSSASSLSTSSSSVENFNNKLCIVNQNRKNDKSVSTKILSSPAKVDSRNGENNNNSSKSNNNNNMIGISLKNKIIDPKSIFNGQKFTRSRRLLLTVSE